MAVNPTSNTIRLMGMSSGLDTDTIIQQTLKLSQMKIDKQFRAKTLLEWKQNSLNSIKSDISSFRLSFLSSSGAKNIRNRNLYNSNVAVLSGKNSDAFSVSTSLSSSLGTIKVGKIESLAKNASLTATNVSLDKKGLTTSSTLADISKNLGTEFQFEKTEVQPPEGPQQPNPDDFKTTVVDEQGVETEVYDEEAYDLAKAAYDEEKEAYDKFVADNYPQYEDRLNFTINGKEISVKSTETLDDLIKKVNNSGAGVTMSYDRLADKLTIESKAGGGTFTVSDKDGSNALKALGFGVEAGEEKTSSAGTMARAYINGAWVESSTNSFDYRGVTITLNKTTTTGSTDQIDDSENDTTVTVKRDATKVVSMVKDFIDSYNTLIKKLEDMLSERKTSTESNYTPLTDEEKAEMTDKQIEEWEAIAKKGILRNDPGIKKMITSLRGALFDAVEGAGISPSAIGLSTGSYFDGTGGQIVLNEDKLKAALEKDPDQVADVFMKISRADTKSSTYYKESGLLNRIDNIMNNYVGTNGDQSRSLETLERSLKQTNKLIDKLKEKMYAEENQLYKKYAALETAMSKLQSQGSYFTSMLGG